METNLIFLSLIMSLLRAKSSGCYFESSLMEGSCERAPPAPPCSSHVTHTFFYSILFSLFLVMNQTKGTTSGGFYVNKSYDDIEQTVGQTEAAI